MRKSLVVGILAETKLSEKRAPLTPLDVDWLVKRGIKVEVQASQQRVFTDREYQQHGARIVASPCRASLMLGIKEPRPQDLSGNKIYMLFSHTIKGQLQNMPLLKACLKQNITLIDYEKITDLYNRRLVYFGKFAGICGSIDSLHYYGKKLEWLGSKNPFAGIKPALEYASLAEAKIDLAKTYKRIQKTGLERDLSPFIIGITGHGNVSRGVQEILGILNPLEIHPKNITAFVKHQKKMHHKIYKIVFLREEKFRHKKGGGFYFEEYLARPKHFESNLDLYLPHLNILINTSYWDQRYPRLISKKMIHRLSSRSWTRPGLIGDLTCDINGSIELTYKASTPENPVYTYNVEKRRYSEGCQSRGIAILAVDNLPSELPKDSSLEFGGLIREYVYQIASHGVLDITRHAALPREIRNAVITQQQRLTENFGYLKKFIL